MRCALPVLFLALIVGCGLGKIEHTGTVVHVDRDGGFWGIVTSDSTRFRPINLPTELEREGIEIEFEGYVLSEERVEDEWGIPVELTEVGIPVDSRDD